jgi:hypothetical protein
MTDRRMRPIAVKEMRALLPVWIAAAVAITAAGLSGPRNHEFGLMALGFGSAALGAQSIGHEYTSRTLTLLLAQPVSRRRVLVLKLAVLTLMLLALAAFATMTLLTVQVPEDRLWLWLSMLNALCLAPLLTIVCRTPIAGVVFTGGAPVWVVALSGVVTPRMLWTMVLAVCVAAAVASWRVFMRLEAIDGRGSEFEMPRLFRAASNTARARVHPGRHPFWQLVKKELHLQQMAFAVGAVWVAIWVAVFTLGPMLPTFAAFSVEVVSALYGVLLALLIGALASAEERQLGTLEWQMLQPLAAWQQWVVKVGTALALAAVLSFALPVMLASRKIGATAPFAAVIFVLTIGSLYISSLCRNSIRALTIAGPTLLGLLALWTYVAGIYSIRYHGPHLVAMSVVLLSAIVPLMLWFSLENHRSSRPGAANVIRQVLWMTGSAAAGIAIVTAIA